MRGMWLPLLLQFFGILIVIAEVIIPSAGLLSLLAMGIFSYSLYMVYSDFGRTAGMVVLIADLVLIPVLVVVSFRMLARSPVTLRAELKREDGVTAQAPDLGRFVGMEGITLSPLRPAGTALLDGHRIDVVSRGEFVEKDVEVVVSAVTGNQIIVTRKHH